MAKAEIIHICTYCGKKATKNTINRDFYRSYSFYHKHTGFTPLCKDCIRLLSLDGLKLNLFKFKNVLKNIDKPFLKNILDSSIDEAVSELQKDGIQISKEVVIEQHGEKIIKCFMKNIVLPQHKGKTWDDGDFDKVSIVQEVTGDFVITNEVKKYWGFGFDEWEYEFLEEELFKLKSSFECPDYGMEMLMRDICFVNLEIHKVRQSGRGDVGKLIETRGKLMNDAKMKPIQATGAEANDQITFGTLIKKWENERPIPQSLDNEMKKYIDTYMIGHLAKMEGLKNELVDKYEKSIRDFTVNFDDVEDKDDE